jgi:hypothetical protein
MKSQSVARVGAVVLGLLLTAGSAIASSIDIPITNPAYDSGISGWGAPDNTAGWDNSMNSPPDSTGGAEYFRANVYQTLATTVAPNTDYTLSAYLLQQHGVTLTLNLYAVNGSTNDLLGSVAYTIPTADTWTPATLTVLAASIPSGDLDKRLMIEAVSAGGDFANGAWGYVDHWSLKATATPEPSTIALLTAAVLGLLCYAWRKQR